MDLDIDGGAINVRFLQARRALPESLRPVVSAATNTAAG